MYNVWVYAHIHVKTMHDQGKIFLQQHAVSGKLSHFTFLNRLLMIHVMNMTCSHAIKAHNSFSIWTQDLRIMNIILEQLERKFWILILPTRELPSKQFVYFSIFFFLLFRNPMISLDPMFYLQVKWFVIVPCLQDPF